MPVVTDGAGASRQLGRKGGRTTGHTSKRAKTGASSLTPETHYADELERGELPSLRRIQREMKLGAPKARQVREQLAAVNNFGQKVAA